MRVAAKFDLVIEPPSNKIAGFAFAPLESPASGQHIGGNHLYATIT
jgi:hypothetical protein